MYSAALVPYFQHFPRWSRFALPYVLTDQAFAVSIVRFQDVDDPVEQRWFFTGAAVTMWITWQLSTLIGVLVGAQLPEALSLEFAIPLVFIALLVLTVRTRPDLVAALVGGTVAVIAAPAPLGLGLATPGLSMLSLKPRATARLRSSSWASPSAKCARGRRWTYSHSRIALPVRTDSRRPSSQAASASRSSTLE